MTAAMTWRDSHHSGKARSTLTHWNLAAGQLVNAHVDVGAFTEFGGIDRLTRLPRGWGQHSSGGVDGADGLILWNGETFRTRAIAKGVEPLTTLDWGARKGVGMHWVNLSHLATGGTLLRWVLHWPSGVQNGVGLRTGKGTSTRDRAAVKAWLDVEKNIGPAVHELVARYDPDAVVGSFDSNVNLLLDAWQKRMAATFYATGLRVLPPESGTLGDRGIDGFVTDAARQRVPGKRKGRVAVTVLRHTPHLDHKGEYVDLIAPVDRDAA